MFIQNQVVTDPRLIFDGIDEIVMQYCEIENFSHDGGNVSGVFLNCSFKNLDFYWGIFNVCRFVSCHFKDCNFRGTAFPDCRFLECSFSDCAFVKDNLDASCGFADAKWYDCIQKGCRGLEHLPLVAK